jgi:hypothetical protein
MKNLLKLFLLAIFVFSCSGDKEKNKQTMMSLMDNNKALIEEQGKVMQESSEYLNKQNAFLLEYATAGATPEEIKIKEKEKENRMNEFSSKLKDIELKMDKNHKIIDSLAKVNK